MRLGSLRLRLLLTGVLAVALALLASALGLVILFERHVERRVDAELNVHLNQLVAGLGRAPSGEIALVQPPAEPRFDRPLSGLYWQIMIEPRGTVLRSRSLWDTELALPARTSDQGQAALQRHRVPGPGGTRLHVLERRYELPARLEAASVRVAAGVDISEIRQMVGGFVSDLMPFLLVIGALLVAAIWVGVTVGLRPLAAVRERLAAIGSGATQRLGAGLPDEVTPLAAEIDALLDARDVQIDKARARAADLAHGLKTPLQVLVSEAARLEAKGEREIAGEVTSLAADMHRHVERQLSRARIAAGAVHARANVGDIAERVISVVQRTPEGQRLTWSINVAHGLAAKIDAADLAEVLGNLIENAARHARSRVTISGRAEREHVLLSVDDDGPGIPVERLEEALSRGGRLDTSGPGAGLGLAIVSDIADAWGAKFSLENGESGIRAGLRLARA